GGTVWVNSHTLIDANLPFGGMKQSGTGRDFGPELHRPSAGGTVWVNSHTLIDANLPFGGMKQSGTGRDFGP
ncbi:hypothetical protein CQA67_33285, partial [Klebsiella pneumoniae]